MTNFKKNQNKYIAIILACNFLVCGSIRNTYGVSIPLEDEEENQIKRVSFIDRVKDYFLGITQQYPSSNHKHYHSDENKNSSSSESKPETNMVCYNDLNEVLMCTYMGGFYGACIGTFVNLFIFSAGINGVTDVPAAEIPIAAMFGGAITTIGTVMGIVLGATMGANLNRIYPNEIPTINVSSIIDSKNISKSSKLSTVEMNSVLDINNSKPKISPNNTNSSIINGTRQKIIKTPIMEKENKREKIVEKTR